MRTIKALHLSLIAYAVAMTLHLDTAALADTFALPPPGDDVIGQPKAVIIQPGDTLLDIARNHDLGYNEIKQANPDVDPWLPKVGTRVILPTQFILPKAPREGIVLNVPEMRLYYFPKAKEDETPVVITHPIGIGREGWATPLGVTKVVAKRPNPTWTVPTSILKEHAAEGDPLPKVVPSGPDNPLGLFAMPLAIPGYLIHGTNKPFGIGRRVSHGCIQLYPEDIATLFKDVPVGTPVRIVNQPYKVGWLNGELYFETHEPLSEEQKKLKGNLTPQVNTILESVKDRSKIDWDKAMDISNNHVGIPMPITPGTPNVDDILARIPVVEERFSKREQGYQEDVNLNPSLEDMAGKWTLLVGKPDIQEEALKLAAMLRHLGPPVPATVTSSTNGYQVLAGPFATQKEALAARKNIKYDLEMNSQIQSPSGKIIAEAVSNKNRRAVGKKKTLTIRR